MSTFTGRWERGGRTERPIVSAHVARSGSVGMYLDFVIDTASDRTFIVPSHQEQLGIPERELQITSQPVRTIAGRIPFAIARNFTISLLRDDGGHFPIPNVTLYFGATKKQLPRELQGLTISQIGEGQDYSILGRDVLQRFAMACCTTVGLLLLTERTREFKQAIDERFPNAPATG